MSRAYSQLMSEVCVKLGFCGSVVEGRPRYLEDFLPKSGLVTANEFADAVFKAEGWDPNGAGAHEHRRSICDAFVRFMGHSEVEAASLR